MPYNYDELKVMGEEQLRTLADSLEVKDTKKINKKEDLAFAILDRQAVLESQKPSEPKPKKRGRPRKSEAAPEAKPAAEASSERKKEEKKPADKAEKSDAAPKSPEKKQQPKQRKEAQQKAEGAKSRKKTGDAAAPAAPTAPVTPAGKPEGDVIADAAAKLGASKPFLPVVDKDKTLIGLFTRETIRKAVATKSHNKTIKVAGGLEKTGNFVTPDTPAENILALSVVTSNGKIGGIYKGIIA